MNALRPTLVLLLAAGLLTGCISVDVGGGSGDEASPFRFHTLGEIPAASLGDGVGPFRLEVAPLDVRPLHQTRVVERAAGTTVRFLERERWAEDVRPGFEFALRDALDRSSSWTVLPAGSYVGEPEYVLHAQLVAFDVVERSSEAWRVEVGVRLVLRAGEAVVHSGVHGGSAATESDDGADLGRAMAAAAGDALAKAHAAWAPLVR